MLEYISLIIILIIMYKFMIFFIIDEFFNKPIQAKSQFTLQFPKKKTKDT